MYNKTNELKKKLQDKFNSRELESHYRTALLFESPYCEDIVERISNALKKNIVEWLLLNGYKPSQLSELMFEEFDYGNLVGVSLSIDAALAEETLPINARLLLALTNNSEVLNDEIQQLKRKNKILNQQISFITRSWMPRCLQRIAKLLFGNPEPNAYDEEE